MNKMMMKWQGPYSVVRKMGPVTYEIHHSDKGKATQTCHINLLKEWKEPPNKPESSLLIREVEEDQEDKQPELRTVEPAQPARVQSSWAAPPPGSLPFVVLSEA